MLVEFDGKFCDGSAEIWTNAQFGWYVPPGYNGNPLNAGYLYSSTNPDIKIDIIYCAPEGTFAKDLNKNHRIPTLIEGDLEKYKEQKKKLESQLS